MIKLNDLIFCSLSDLIQAEVSNINLIEINTQSSHSNYPKKFRLANLLDLDCVPSSVREKTYNIIKMIQQNYQIKNTLSVVYLPNCYIDWHTNENIPYYNAICTFSSSGNSFFEYKKDNIPIRINDPVGWYVKKTKWSSKDPVWHRAFSKCIRITLTFSSDQEEKINKFIRDKTKELL